MRRAGLAALWLVLECGGRVDAADVTGCGHAVGDGEVAELRIWATEVHGRDVDASRNGGAGVVASFDIDVRRLRAIDNGREGVRLARFRGGDGRIVDSVVVRNDRLGQGFDIAAAGRLRLVRTQCGRSAKLRYRRHPETNGYRPRVVGSFGCAQD